MKEGELLSAARAGSRTRPGATRRQPQYLSTRASLVEEHYTRCDLPREILAGLMDAGLDLHTVTVDDLAPVDEFHVRGREATDELAQLVGFGPGQRVLDVGSGLGGTARYLAGTRAVMVTGVDVTAEYCRLGNLLSEYTGLADQVELVCADAVELPFAAERFDFAWSEHAAMNIADKTGLYREIRRTLGSGGCLAFYDVISGDGGAVHFPVSWAADPEISFLSSEVELLTHLAETGFQIVAWRDVSGPGLHWMREFASELENATGPLGPQLLMGAEWPEMVTNQIRNLEEDRIRLVQVVARSS